MADMTRRTLLTLGGAAGVLALAGPADATTAGTGLRPSATGAAIGQRASFASLLGRSLTVTGGSGSHRLLLERIADVDRTGQGSANSFNLIFRQADDNEFVEAIYRLPTSWLARTSLLLSPIGPAGPSRRIQALINRG